MRTLRFVAFTSLVALSPACSKKPADAPAPTSAPSATTAAEPVAAPAPAPGAAEPAATAVPGCPAHLSGTETGDVTIKKECGTVEVRGDYEVNGGTLTLEAGAKLSFAADASLQVGYSAPSKLVVKGTAAEPVVFASAGDQEAGAWRGVTLYDGADRSSVEHLEIAHAGTDDSGALFLSSGVEGIKLSKLTFRGVRGPGLRVDIDAKPADISGCTFTEAGTPVAMNLGASAVQALKGGHAFGDGAVIRVQGGTLKETQSWVNPGVPLLVTGNLEVQGDGVPATLTLAAGTTLRFTPDAGIDVGYSGHGKLVAVGTAEAPITFTAAEGEAAGAWGAVRVYGQGSATVEHVVFQYGGGGDAEAPLVVTGKVSVSNTTFRDAKKGVRAEAAEATFEKLETTKFERVPTAIALFASQLGQLGSGNTYDEGARIDVRPNDVETSATWRAQKPAVVVFLEGEAGVGGGATVTVEAGSTFAMGEGASLGFGYSGAAIVKMEGTAEAPISFRGLRGEPGAWGSLHLYGQARGSVLRHVQLANASDAGAIVVDDEAEATLEHVACSQCAGPAVAHACKAKVTLGEIRAAEEGAVAVKAPEGCE